MSENLSRRGFLAAVPAVLSTAAVSTAPNIVRAVPTSVPASRPADSGRFAPEFPRQDTDLVREMVGVSHFNIDRVRELLEMHPALVNAAWDWGFGDWETALGAAAHTGRREIAELLLSRGARLDLFAAAMLGHLSVVRSIIETSPGIQRTRGPHGIPLLDHAEAGGEPAEAVVAYLNKVEGAGLPYPSEPISPREMVELAGSYASAAPNPIRFTIVFEASRRRGGRAVGPELSFKAGKQATRALVHVGRREFHPVGAPNVRLRFAGEVVQLTDGPLTLTTTRVGK